MKRKPAIIEENYRSPNYKEEDVRAYYIRKDSENKYFGEEVNLKNKTIRSGFVDDSTLSEEVKREAEELYGFFPSYVRIF